MSQSTSISSSSAAGMSVPGASRDERDAWALASSAATEGLWYWDVPGKTLRASPRTDELLGLPADRRMFSVADVLRHVDAVDLPRLRRGMRALITGRVTRFDAEIRMLTHGGERRWMQLRARATPAADGRPRLVAGSLADVDVRRTTEDRLRQETRHDPLTGLPNRLALMDSLCARIARAATHPGSPFAVAYIDLDDFKVVNDTLGHACGDTVLATTARRISRCLGAGDLLARMSGDEFVAIIDDAGKADDVARAVHGAMALPITAGGRQVFSALSIGIRTSTGESCKPSDVIRDADLAMYAAKTKRGPRTAHFDPAMRASMLRRFTVQNELQTALYEDQFRLSYHPVFDTEEDRLCGFEALLRWDHPTRGALRAEVFIHDANESGVIVPIGRWVMRQACSHIADWEQAYPHSARLSVGVNLCDRELLDPEFANAVQRAVEEAGIDPSQLRLEMTEGALAGRLDAVVPALQRLRALGVQLQLDNFGAGRMSLGMLRRLPLTAVKIDRHLIRDVVTCGETRALVETILTYADGLGLAVIAEGVETPEQVEVLARLGPCRYVQGPLVQQLAEAGQPQ